MQLHVDFKRILQGWNNRKKKFSHLNTLQNPPHKKSNGPPPTKSRMMERGSQAFREGAHQIPV